MASNKSTQAAPAAFVKSAAIDAEIIKLRDYITEADSFCQGANRSISAATTSILLALREPDSPAMRLRIKALCEIIQYESHDCMNSVNASAEELGANFISPDREDDRLICAAARGEVQA